ncbi:MAG: manganese-dependent transcriptional regulator PerR [Thermaceae bacterium]
MLPFFIQCGIVRPVRRLTQQKRAVLEVVRQAHHHPDAAWVYQEVRKRLPRISLGTVYRNLEALVEEGYLIPLPQPGGATRYDANTHPHLHLICERCGEIVDLEVALPDLLTPARLAHPEVEIRTVEVVYRGLCPKCRQAPRG